MISCRMLDAWVGNLAAQILPGFLLLRCPMHFPLLCLLRPNRALRTSMRTMQPHSFRHIGVLSPGKGSLPTAIGMILDHFGRFEVKAVL